jgi:hypothetical protein
MSYSAVFTPEAAASKSSGSLSPLALLRTKEMRCRN